MATSYFWQIICNKLSHFVGSSSGMQVFNWCPSMMSTQGMRMLPQFFRDGSMNVPVLIPDAFLPWPEALVYKKCGCCVGWEIGHAGSKRKAKQLSGPKVFFADIFAFHSSCCLEKQCRIHVAWCNCGAKYVPCSKRSADCHLRRRRPCTRRPLLGPCLSSISQASSRKLWRTSFWEGDKASCNSSLQIWAQRTL